MSTTPFSTLRNSLADWTQFLSLVFIATSKWLCIISHTWGLHITLYSLYVIIVYFMFSYPSCFRWHTNLLYIRQPCKVNQHVPVVYSCSVKCLLFSQLFAISNVRQGIPIIFLFLCSSLYAWLRTLAGAYCSVRFVPCWDAFFKLLIVAATLKAKKSFGNLILLWCPWDTIIRNALHGVVHTCGHPIYNANWKWCNRNKHDCMSCLVVAMLWRRVCLVSSGMKSCMYYLPRL